MDIPTSIESNTLESVPSEAVRIDKDTSQDNQQQQQQKQATVTFRNEVDISTISSDNESDVNSVESVDRINQIVESSSEEEINTNDNNINITINTKNEELIEEQKEKITALQAVSPVVFFNNPIFL